MNKKANTILFMLGATLLNVVMMIVIFLALMMLYAWLVGDFGTQLGQIMGIVLFLASIGLTYFFYHRMVKWISNKWDLEEYFDPIFGKRGGQQKKGQ